MSSLMVVVWLVVIVGALGTIGYLVRDKFPRIKTNTYAIVLAVVGAMQAFDWSQIVSNLPPQWQGLALFGVAVGTAVLRAITKGPVVEPLPEPPGDNPDRPVGM